MIDLFRTPYRYLYKQLHILTSQKFNLKIAQTQYKVLFSGSSYGGWNYLDHNLHQDSIIYSFGVGEDVSFDLDLINNHNVSIHGFDPTPRSINWVRKHVQNSQFHMHPWGISNYDGEAFFSAPTNEKHISHSIGGENKNGFSAHVYKLDSIMKKLLHSKIDLLKMDIEGQEYSVIENMMEEQIYPTQLLVEYHHRSMKNGKEKTMQSIALLESHGYQAFAISKSHEEICFVKL